MNWRENFERVFGCQIIAPFSAGGPVPGRGISYNQIKMNIDREMPSRAELEAFFHKEVPEAWRVEIKDSAGKVEVLKG